MNLKPLAQEQAWNTLAALAPRLPQGLILVGPAGVGKKRAVRALFQWINCAARAQAPDAADGPGLFGETPAPSAPAKDFEGPCGGCASCRKIASGLHTDLVEISPKGEQIAVDDLREMKKMLFFAPMEARQRFVIIDEAHKLNASSANTILKTLEEPPEHTRFFLVTHERGLLLPTIVSRCQFVHFSPLPREAIEQLLDELKLEIPSKLLPVCLELMGGGLERAVHLADEKTLSFLEEVQALLTSPPSRWEQVTQLAEKLGTDDWRLELLLDLLILAGNSKARKAGDTPARLAASNAALEAAYLRRRLDRHANKKLVALAAANLVAASGASGAFLRGASGAFLK